jgi:hypothetical protein
LRVQNADSSVGRVGRIVECLPDYRYQDGAQVVGKMRRSITVNDLMQRDYRYELVEPVGRNFDPDFKPDLTPAAAPRPGPIPHEAPSAGRR